jgi:PadR family transcriptional regulator PadR
MRAQELKRTILRMYGGGEFYGYDVHKRLALAGIQVEVSYLYRVLNEMLREGLLEGRWEKSPLGPRKRIYRVDKQGREELERTLLDAIGTVHMFYGKYLMGLAPKLNVVEDICTPLMDGLQEKCNIGVLASQYSPMIEGLIRTMRGISPGGKTFLIKPASGPDDLKLHGLTVIAGTYNDIPLRKDLLDLLLVIGLPPKNSLATALAHWHRVLNSGARLAVMVPTILLEAYEDPLTIGDFVEKHEHETIEMGERIDKEALLALLKDAFIRVEERQIVHITILQASRPQ